MLYNIIDKNKDAMLLLFIKNSHQSKRRFLRKQFYKIHFFGLYLLYNDLKHKLVIKRNTPCIYSLKENNNNSKFFAAQLLPKQLNLSINDYLEFTIIYNFTKDDFDHMFKYQLDLLYNCVLLINGRYYRYTKQQICDLLDLLLTFDKKPNDIVYEHEIPIIEDVDNYDGDDSVINMNDLEYLIESLFIEEFPLYLINENCFIYKTPAVDLNVFNLSINNFVKYMSKLLKKNQQNKKIRKRSGHKNILLNKNTNRNLCGLWLNTQNKKDTKIKYNMLMLFDNVFYDYKLNIMENFNSIQNCMLNLMGDFWFIEKSLYNKFLIQAFYAEITLIYTLIQKSTYIFFKILTKRSFERKKFYKIIYTIVKDKRYQKKYLQQLFKTIMTKHSNNDIVTFTIDNYIPIFMNKLSFLSFLLSYNLLDNTCILHEHYDADFNVFSNDIIFFDALFEFIIIDTSVDVDYY